jgi:hypothetical protein
MAQRRNYGFERRRKAEVRQAKQAAKQQRRTERAASGAAGPEMGEPPETGPAPGMWEWFSPSRGRTVSVAAGMRPPSDAPDDWMPLTDAAAEHEQAHADDPGDGGPR